jgi:WS/DGAT/MGAT family acyltransferase
MHMASVGIFDCRRLYDAQGNFRIADIRRLIASRLKLVPKLRQRPCPSPLGQAPPVWLDYPDFDITEHVRVCQLTSPATEAELRQLCADLMSVPLDRARPLWDMTFVEGLDEGRVALVERLHHSMADGLAAVELATVLLDLSPESPPFDESGASWMPSERASTWRASADDLLRLGALPVQAAKWYVETVAHPIRRIRGLTDLARAFGTIVTPRIVAPKSSLNGPITAARAVDFVRLPLADVHEVAHSFDSTINDVLLTLVAGGMRALLKNRGELTESSEIQVLVPVGLIDSEGRGLGNSVSALFVRLPVCLDDAVDVLSAVSAEVGEDKRRHQALAAASFLRFLEPVPQNLLAKGAGIMHYQPFFNLIVTNVPGPPVPLYALGARLVEAFPILPLVGNQSLAVAALSYEGQLNLGVLSDPAACPDALVFCAGVRTCHESLVERSRGDTANR